MLCSGNMNYKCPIVLHSVVCVRKQKYLSFIFLFLAFNYIFFAIVTAITKKICLAYYSLSLFFERNELLEVPLII